MGGWVGMRLLWSPRQGLRLGREEEEEEDVGLEEEEEEEEEDTTTTTTYVHPPTHPPTHLRPPPTHPPTQTPKPQHLIRTACFSSFFSTTYIHTY